MKTQLFLSLCAASALLLSSCITAAATAATGAVGTAAGGSAGLSALGLRSLLRSSGAPVSMEGHTLYLTGSPENATLIFPQGVETNMGYARLSDKTATITCATEEGAADVYHLTFTGSSEGTYALDRTAADGSLSTGHGTFSIK